MVVALVANHARNGFFIFRPGEGYEYVLMIILVACAIGALGGGDWSVDHAIGFSLRGWAGLALAAVGGRRRRRPAARHLLAAAPAPLCELRPGCQRPGRTGRRRGDDVAGRVANQ